MFENEKNLSLTDLVDVHFLQEFQDVFAKTMNVASIMVDSKGPITKPSNFTDFCIKYTRSTLEGYKRCNECDLKWGKLASNKREPVIYNCHTGLTDFAVPIIVEGKHIGSILGGQVMTEAPDEDHFREIARQIGVNEDEYIEALRKIKIVPIEKVQEAAQLLYIVANIISEIGHKNLELIEKNDRDNLYKNIVETIRSSLDIVETEQKIINIVGKTLNADRCFIVDYDKVNDKFLIVKDEYLSSNNILTFTGIDVNVAFPNFAAAVKKGKPLIINNKEIFLQTDNQNFDVDKKTMKKYGINSAFVFPVYYFEEFLGLLAIHYVNKKHTITSEEINLITMIADQIAIALHQANLYKATQVQAEKDKLYKSITETIRSSLDIDKTKKQICEIIGQKLNADRCFIAEYDKEKDKFLIVNDEYLSSDEIEPYKGSDANLDVPNFSAALKKGNSLIINNKDEILIDTEDKNFDSERKAIEKYKVLSAFAVPLFYNNELLGVFAVHYVKKQYFVTENEISLINTIVDQIAIALHQARLYDALTQTTANQNAILNNMPFMAWLKDNKSRLLAVNEAFAKMCGTKVENIIGKTDFDFFPQDQAELYVEEDRLVIEARHTVPSEELITGPEGAKWHETFKSPVFDNKGNVVGTVGLSRDMTERKESEMELLRRQEQITKANEREVILRKTIEIIRSSIDLDFVKHEMVFQIGSFLKADRVAFADYDVEKGNYFTFAGNEYRSSENVKSFIGYDFAATPGFIESIREVHLTGKDIIFSDLNKYLEDHNLKGTAIERFYKEMGFMSSMAININYGDIFYGNLVVTFEQKHDITQEDIAIVKTLADQAGIAIYQSTLYKKEKQTAEREALLRKIFETIRSTLDLKELFQLVCSELASAFNIQRSFIVEFKKHKKHNEIIVQSEFKSSPEIKGLLDKDFDKRTVEYWGEVLLEEGKTIIIDNIPESDTPEYFKETYKNIGLKSIMGFAIKQGDDKWGWVGVSEYNYYRHWTKDEITLLETISNQIYIAIKQAELYKITQDNAKRDSLLRNITEKIRSSLDIEETLYFICEETAKLFNVQRTAISVFTNSEKYEDFVVRKEYKISAEIKGIAQGGDFSKAAAYWGYHLINSGKALAIDNVQESDTPDYFKNAYASIGAKSLIGTYIGKGKDAWGTLVLSEYNTYRHWTKEEKTLLKTIGTQVYIAINQAELYEKEKKTAEREKLIGKVLSRAISTFDINQIKQIVNDIGIITKADRCYFVEVDLDNMKGKPIDYDGEYLASPDIKSIIGYEFSTEDVKLFVEMYLAAKDLIVFDYASILQQPSGQYDGMKRYINQCDLKSAIGIPFYYMDKLTAVLAIEYATENMHPSDDELDFLRILGNQIGMAFSQIQLYQDTKKTAEREKLLRVIIETIRSSLDTNKVKNQIITYIGKVLNADRCFIVDFNQHKQQFLPIANEYLSSADQKSVLGVDVNEDFPLLAESIKLGNEDNIIIDVEKFSKEAGSEFESEIIQFKKYDVKSDYAILITNANGFAGVLVIHYTGQKRDIGEENIKFLKILASQAGIAIYQSQLLENEKKIAERERLIGKVISKVISTFDITQFKQIVNDVGIMTKADRCYFVELDLERMKGIPIDYDGEYLASQDIESIMGYDFPSEDVREFIEVFIEVKDLVVFDYSKIKQEKSEYYDGMKRYCNRFQLQNSIAIPFYYMDKLTAVLVIEYVKSKVLPSDDQLNFLRILANQTGMAFNQIQLYQNTKITAENEKVLRGIMLASVSTFDLKDIVRSIVTEAGKLFNADRCFFAEFNVETDSILPRMDYSEYLSSKDIPSIATWNLTTEETNVFLGATKNKEFVIVEDIDKIDLPDITRMMLVEGLSVKSYVIIPVFYGDTVYGALVLHYVHNFIHFTQNAIDMSKAIANQSAIVIHQAQLYEKTKDQAKRETLLRKVIEEIRSSIDIDKTLTIICDEVAKIFKVQRATIVEFYDKKDFRNWITRREFRAREDIKGVNDVSYEKSAGEYNGQVILQEGKNLVIDSIEEADVPDFYKNTYQNLGVKSVLSVPIQSGEDKFGIIFLSAVDEYIHWTKEDVQLLENIAAQIYVAIRQSELFENQKKTAERETLLRKIIETVRSSLDINVVKKNIIYEIGKAFNADRCYFRSYDTVKNKFLPVDSEYLSSSDIESLVGVEPNQEALILFLEEIKKQNNGFYPIIVDEDFAKNTSLESYVKEFHIKADYGIPIAVRPNEPTWLVLHYSKEDPKLNEDYKKLLETIAYQIEIAFSQIALYDTVKNTAEKESLLRQIFETIRGSLDIDVTKKQIVNIIGKTLKVDRCFISEYDKYSEELLTIKDEYVSSPDIDGYEGMDVNRVVPKFANALKDGKTLLINNKEIFIDIEDQNFDVEKQIIEQYKINSSYVVPLFYLDELLGTLSIHYVGREHFITNDEINLINTLAEQVAIALYQARLYKITQVQAEREKISKNIIEILRSTLDKNMIKHLFVQNIGKYFKANRVFFSDYDPQSKMYLPVDSSSEYLSSSDEKSFVGYDWSDPSIKEYIQPLLEKREIKIPCWPDYIRENPKSQSFISLFEDANVKSSYNLPVLYQQKIMGYFCIEFTQNSCHKLSNEDISSIRSMCAQAGMALYHSEVFLQAQESARSKGEFIANISNELNLPLNNLIEFSDILSTSEFDCSKQIEYLTNINQSSKQLLDLKNDIIIINTIESENFKLDYENVDSEELIMGVINSIKSVANNRNVSIDSEISNTNMYVDKKMFAQILYNLINNAIKLTSDKVHITIKSALEDDKVVTSIEVSGVGVMTDNQNIAFEKFKQVDSSYPRRQKGVGLELSIATKLIEFHKGSIHVESTEDKGTLIWFAIPNARR